MHKVGTDSQMKASRGGLRNRQSEEKANWSQMNAGEPNQQSSPPAEADRNLETVAEKTHGDRGELFLKSTTSAGAVRPSRKGKGNFLWGGSSTVLGPWGPSPKLSMEGHTEKNL